MNTVDIELEDQAEIEREAGQRLRGRLPLRLTLRGDLSDIGNVLLALRALGGFDSGPMHYPIYRLLRAVTLAPGNCCQSRAHEPRLPGPGWPLKYENRFGRREISLYE